MAENILGDWKKRYPNFTPQEVLSPDILQFGRHLINVDALDKLQDFRRWLGKSFIINTPAGNRLYRGQRSWEEQQKVNPGVWSCHLVGCAWDCTPVWFFGAAPECGRITWVEFRDKALEYGWTGVGFYPQKNFVHIDSRPLLHGQSAAVQ